MKSSSTQQTILSTVRDIQAKQTTHGEQLARMDTKLTALVGNGQPGRVGKLEEDVKAASTYIRP